MPGTSRREICPLLYIGYIINPDVVESVAVCFKDRCGMRGLCRALPMLIEEMAGRKT